MNSDYSDDELYALAVRSRGSVLHSYAAKAVTEHFRSMHYKSSILVCDCVVLCLLLNDDITYSSVNRILTSMRRKNKSLYTTVYNAFIPISESFNEYAKTILNDEYEKIQELNLRTVNYIVYVISQDVKIQYKLDKREVYLRAYNYTELLYETHKESKK